VIGDVFEVAETLDTVPNLLVEELAYLVRHEPRLTT
jgi:hypothetical protein